MKKTKKVVAAILYRKAASGVEIFAARRNHGEFTGFWEFPGGKVEAGETAETALYREVREELVADIIIEKSFTVVEFEYPSKGGLSQKLAESGRRPDAIFSKSGVKHYLFWCVGFIFSRSLHDRKKRLKCKKSHRYYRNLFSGFVGDDAVSRFRLGKIFF